MRKILFIISISAALNTSNFCQNTYTKIKFTKTVENLYSGFKESIAWYDIPIAISFFGRNSITPNNFGDKIVLSPSNFEKEFAEDNGKDGRYTVGSIDKDIIPNTIFYSRLASNVLLDMFTDTDLSKDSYKNIFVFRKSLIYTYTLTEYVKSIIKKTRPDGTDDRSFFSGHAATTFAAATYLWKELHVFYNEWDITKSDLSLKRTFEIGTFAILYGWAGFVGYSRIKDNKHYLSDVIVGATVGTLISHFVYELYNKNDTDFLENFNLVTSQNNSLGLAFNVKF